MTGVRTVITLIGRQRGEGCVWIKPRRLLQWDRTAFRDAALLGLVTTWGLGVLVANLTWPKFMAMAFTWGAILIIRYPAPGYLVLMVLGRLDSYKHHPRPARSVDNSPKTPRESGYRPGNSPGAKAYGGKSQNKFANPVQSQRSRAGQSNSGKRGVSDDGWESEIR